MVKTKKEFLAKAIGDGSIRSLEKKCNHSHGALAPVLNGRAEISLNMAKKICNETEATIEDFLAVNCSEFFSEDLCQIIQELRTCSPEQLKEVCAYIKRKNRLQKRRIKS